MTRGIPPAVGALVVLILLAVVAACEAAAPAAMQVRLDGRPLEVLVAGPDGMRGRTFDGADAMLFAWPVEQDPAAVRFVMDGVTMPLDVAFFDGTGRWLGTTRMEPCTVTPCPRFAAPAPFRWALEAPAGGFLVELSSGARLEVGSG